MRRIYEVKDREFAWTQIGYFHGEYELRAGDETVATLRWRGGSLAVAETADGRWSFERPGYRRSRVSVRTAGSGTENATFSSGWTGGGVLEMSRGRRFWWTPANFWRSRWEWRDGDGTPLVRLASRQGLTKVEGHVEIGQPALDLPELDLLVVLGWYLTVMRAQDATEDAVATTAGTAGS